ncbi:MULTISPECIES: EAL domain-containing protein [Cyanophyceae]|uniref:EAL domain-containing protein n=1 Tax=Cyanophyceae TaxID=3028117 RepID=UPI001689328A|nr:EAL domain-containing protein [Trichocoleus sp. FACHB-69]MBD1935311.1 EAL domain-containing protein [Trichocoleus sp. FACHB-69]
MASEDRNMGEKTSPRQPHFLNKSELGDENPDSVKKWWWRSLGGAIATLSVAGGSVLGIWQPLEQIAYRGLFHLRGSINWDERVALIVIDDASLRELGRFPWPRKQYTKLVNKLSSAEASVVVMDVLMPESSPDDGELAAAMLRQGRVVLAQGWDATGAALLPTPVLRESAIALGHVSNTPDTDGITRKVSPQFGGVPILGITGLRVYALTKESVKLPNMNRPLWVNWPGSMSQMPQYSFASVVQGKVPASVFKGKIVLVGATALGLDPINTPFDGHPPASGVHLHAAVVNNILQQNYLRIVDERSLLVYLLLGGLVLNCSLSVWNAKQQLIAVASLCSGWVMLSLLLLHTGYLIPIATPLVLFGLTAISLSVQERLKMKAQLQRIEGQQQQRRLYDSLTSLPNRALFQERLQLAVERSQEWEDDLFAVCLLDLDRFKVINESLGHTVGDQLLVAIAHRLSSIIRPIDTVARLGGDEFTILLEDIHDLSDATRVAEDINSALAAPFHLNGYEIFATTSIGIAVNSSRGQEENSKSDLLRDADIALYQAKAQGGGRYVVFDASVQKDAIALLQLETDLRLAIGALINTPSTISEFAVYYQPIVSLSTGKITGFEALVRWQHPRRGIVYPGDFIPVAEETGLIAYLDWWVMGEACRQVRAWQKQFSSNNPLTIGINLSSRQFDQSDMVERIDEIIRDTGLESSSLKLEITETCLLENAEKAIAHFEQLKALGIKLAIDDFGTGYSSLDRLHRLPIDILKIDRSFVNSRSDETDKWEIVRTIIMLARNLGLDVVAEGVETTDQLFQLKQLQCDYGQGYFFSKPVDAMAAEALLVSQFQ